MTGIFDIRKTTLELFMMVIITSLFFCIGSVCACVYAVEENLETDRGD